MLQKAKMVVKNSLSKLHTSKCKVIVRRSVKDPVRKIREYKEETVYEELPCRLSFSSSNLDDKGKTTSMNNKMTLFVDSSVFIPEASKILLNQNNVDFILINSKVKTYDTHNEYEVTEFKGWI